MSYWVYLSDKLDGEPLPVEHIEGEGGTYALEGTDKAEINITYNYSEAFHAVDPEYPCLKDKLHGQRAADVTPWLEFMVGRLGTRQYKEDYWAPTPGNAGHALNILLGWARQHPDGVFEVS